MTDLRNKIILPPAQQIEELTKDVNKLQQDIEELYGILNNMAGAFLELNQRLNELGRLVMIMRGVDVRESDQGVDGVEGDSI